MKETLDTLEKKLKEAEERKFYIDMIDHWTHEDRERYEAVWNEIVELKAKIAEIKELKNE